MDAKEINWNGFLNCIKHIKELSDELQDGWILHGDMSIENGAYLTKTNRKIINDNKEILTFEYHIAYSISYSVPILCFNISKTDGSLLKLEESFQFLSLDTSDDLLSTLTQTDHPNLQRPFLTLHPCKTANLIQQTFFTSKNFVVSWLSSIAPAVNLHISNEYSKLT